MFYCCTGIFLKPKTRIELFATRIKNLDNLVKIVLNWYLSLGSKVTIIYRHTSYCIESVGLVTLKSYGSLERLLKLITLTLVTKWYASDIAIWWTRHYNGQVCHSSTTLYPTMSSWWHCRYCSGMSPCALDPANVFTLCLWLLAQSKIEM